ncbi:MAG: GNAT family N-acetyltransferase [Catenulispora sp.]|nr:GNAT family N-acetyltransferase [Catenulispora sp.]
MTARDQFAPVAAVPRLTLEPADDDLDRVAATLARIGAPHGWKSVDRTPRQWQDWFAERPGRRYWLLRLAGEDDPAGAVVCDPHPGGDVEIKSFGLVPEMVGKGLGGYALTLAVNQAWNLHPDVSRVWLHTSSHDHPGALPNYLRRGFRIFKTEAGD